MFPKDPEKWNPEKMNEDSVIACRSCHLEFGLLKRKFHCRRCGDVVCGECSTHLIANKRVCNGCYEDHSYLFGEQRKQSAHDAYKKKNWKGAFALYSALEDKLNDGIVACRLGIMYERGQGTKQDKNVAIQYFNSALPCLINSKTENVQAIFYLGLMYDNGYGVPKDIKEAINLYKEAADKGDPFAQYNLGLIYQ